MSITASDTVSVSAINMYDFIYEHTKEKHLRLSDIQNLNPGDQLDVVIWDSNLEEYGIWDKLKKDTHYSPEEFFKSNHHQLTYLGNYEWDIYFTFEEGDLDPYRHPVHIMLKDSENIFEIHDGYVCLPKFNGEQKKICPVDEVDKDCKIGWRGPMMLWSDLLSYNSQKVYYTDFDETE